MRLLPTLLFLLFSCTGLTFGAPTPNDVAQSSTKDLIGGWESSYAAPDGRRGKLVMTITPTHLSMASYFTDNGEFIATLGGPWRADSETFSLTYEYDSSSSEQVGSVTTMPYEVTGNFLIFNGNKFWTRIDDGTEGEVAGAWEITARAMDGELQPLSQERINGPRKTMKILSGTRFQWIAFNTETREMIATGGGTYTTTPDGKYTEKIEFFSKDQSRVGAYLGFAFELVDGEWDHQGSSSKGDLIHERWSRRR